MSHIDRMETANLIIRPSEFEDCEFFSQAESDPRINKNLALDNDHSYKAVVSEFLVDSRDSTKRHFTITLKPEGKPIGRVLLTKINRDVDSLNLTRLYIADPDEWRKGYGEEAIRAILEYAFINLHMERVAMDHLANDTAAEFLGRKLGCKDEGVMRHAGKQEGKYIDYYRISLLRSEYYENLHAK
ncbi:MAG: GNAT family N-acetyltransferase [Eubacterium sp.]|nr:GNAT family N-acetyltransferase [Eubacterium sp.]